MKIIKNHSNDLIMDTKERAARWEKNPLLNC